MSNIGGLIMTFFAELSDLEKLVENNPNSNFFIDEAPVSEENFPTEMLAQISKKVSPNNTMWIACQSDKLPYTENSNLAGKITTFVFKCAVVISCHYYSNKNCKDQIGLRGHSNNT